MKLGIIYYTSEGARLAEKIWESAPSPDLEPLLFDGRLKKEPLEELFATKSGILFICACGIAVRKILPFVRDKLTDSPVVVTDEGGRYVIPILSGHVGGANELADQLAGLLHGETVITTATDSRGLSAVDMLAKKYHLRIMNREGIAAVTAKQLEGEELTFGLDPEHSEAAYHLHLEGLGKWQEGEGISPDVFIGSEAAPHGTRLWLKPKEIVCGIGCRSGKTWEELEEFVSGWLEKKALCWEDIRAITSVDRKAEEPGLVELAQRHGIPFVTYDAERLERVPGDFEGSDFVRQQVGVDNVCERSAMAYGGCSGEMILKKQTGDGMTLSLVYLPWDGREKGKNPVVYVVGMGPGAEEQMTPQVAEVLEQCDLIVGYPLYLELLGKRFAHIAKKSTPMRQELERCRICLEEASMGQRVAMVCSGDAGVYGMAAPLLEMAADYPGCEVVVLPGITAASAGAAVLGAPLNHDFCVISLSDLLTPWEVIENRLKAAAMGDFAIVLYNPSSRKRADYLERACKILLDNGCLSGRACGYVENIGREGTRAVTLTLEELMKTQVNMFTTVFIGNSRSFIRDRKLITGRGYEI